MAWLEIDNLRKTYPSGPVALAEVNLAVNESELFTILGPSNAGKSTLLKTIAGIERPDRGSIRLSGRDITTLAPRDRHVSLLFQNIALFPNRTGYENIAFPLRVSKASEGEIRSRVSAVAALLKVNHLLDRLPATYSGGERQRVAIGRSIIQPGNLLMLDEPLTNLDARLRIALRLEFRKFQRETGRALLYVTHDQIEAMSISDRIGILNNGRFEQIGTPDEIYRRPVSAFVAQCVGSPPMNFLDVDLAVEGSLIHARAKDIDVAIRGEDITRALPARAAIGVRPEEITLSLASSPGTPHPGRVLWIERLGSHAIIEAELGGQNLKIRARPDHPAREGSAAWIGFSTSADRILDRTTGLFLAKAASSVNAENAGKEIACV